MPPGPVPCAPFATRGIVDLRMKVYGVQDLGIVDASIMPIIPDQSTGGPVYMIAEKAAQMTK